MFSSLAIEGVSKARFLHTASSHSPFPSTTTFPQAHNRMGNPTRADRDTADAYHIHAKTDAQATSYIHITPSKKKNLQVLSQPREPQRLSATHGSPTPPLLTATKTPHLALYLPSLPHTKIKPTQTKPNQHNPNLIKPRTWHPASPGSHRISV